MLGAYTFIILLEFMLSSVCSVLCYSVLLVTGLVKNMFYLIQVLLLLLLLSHFSRVRPQRWQPTRLLCLWDSPGKNAGVGCHFLLPKVLLPWLYFDFYFHGMFFPILSLSVHVCI